MTAPELGHKSERAWVGPIERLTNSLRSSVNRIGGGHSDGDGQQSDGEYGPRSQPDVVLMDIRMPNMDGVEATHWIKAHWPHIRVILLTIHDHYREQAIATEADAFMVKGCPTEELLRTLWQKVQAGDRNDHAHD